MKIKQNKRSKKPVIITSAIIALALGGSAIAYQVTQSNNDTAKTDTSRSKSDSEKTNTDDLKKDTKEPTAESNKSTTNTDPQAPTSTDTSTGKTVVSVVSSVNISNGVVYIRGGINNVVDSNGNCYALLKSSSGATIRKDTTLLPSASTSDCKTIQIKTSELTAGAWTYTLNYSSNAEEGVSSEGTFSIQ